MSDFAFSRSQSLWPSANLLPRTPASEDLKEADHDEQDTGRHLRVPPHRCCAKLLSGPAAQPEDEKADQSRAEADPEGAQVYQPGAEAAPEVVEAEGGCQHGSFTQIDRARSVLGG